MVECLLRLKKPMRSGDWEDYLSCTSSVISDTIENSTIIEKNG